MHKQIKVFCVADYFLPGCLGGGPITTINNMRKLLLGKVSFSVYTRDRDLGSIAAYNEIIANKWISVPEGFVYYASPDNFGAWEIIRMLGSGKYDIIYFNSFFSPKGSIFPLFLLKLLNCKITVLLAPRGEFSQGALALKSCKKKFYLIFSKILKLYNNISWHASSTIEAEDILKIFPNAEKKIFIAGDPVNIENSCPALTFPIKESGRLRIVFISRISPMKNIDYLLDILSSLSASVQLDIYGPIEDKNYWRHCIELIKKLPKNIQVILNEPISHNMVSSVFAKYDYFLFPTRGENFGHVIFECLRAGTPVLLSDRTPWKPDDTGAVSVIPLDNISSWREAIVKVVEMSHEEHERLRFGAISYANTYAEHDSTRNDNFEIFSKSLN